MIWALLAGWITSRRQEPALFDRRLNVVERLRILVSVAVLVAACGGEVSPQPSSGFGEADSQPVASTSEPAGSGTLEEHGSGAEIEEPPPVNVQGGDVELSLSAWTACWSNGCYDGAPPNVLPDIGSPGEITIEFPVAGWEFSAMVQPVGVACGRRQSEPLARIGETVHRLEPIGPAGDYEVTLFGRGDGGDLFVSFRWQTVTDGVMPVPAATASILADHDGATDSYGVELPVWNLRETPGSASATVSVTAADGNRHIIEVTRQDSDCSEGTLYFTAPAAEGLAAAQIGPPPFTYEVILVLDGQTYTGRGTWPEGVDSECNPCVPLTFEPPLPALSSG